LPAFHGFGCVATGRAVELKAGGRPSGFLSLPPALSSLMDGHTKLVLQTLAEKLGREAGE
jgi:hypothetical protein